MKKIFSNFKIKIILCCAFIAALACGWAYWYFGYYTRTPEYAIKMISQAVNEHDINTFNKYVNREKLLESLSDALINDLMHSNQHASENTSLALQEYSSIFKATFVKNLDTALNYYIKNGQWPENAAADEETADYMRIIQGIGFNNISVTGYEITTVDKTAKTAIVNIDATQNEIEQHFTFELLLAQQDNGRWMIEKANNFPDFLTLMDKSRKKYMKDYVKKTDALMLEHKKNFTDIDEQIQEIINSGNIGNNEVRSNLKRLITNSMLPHWHMFREALASVNPPKSAETLQKLRLQICDDYISYYDNYADWLDNKDIKSLRDANNSLKKAKTLETNEANLTNIIKKDLAQ